MKKRTFESIRLVGWLVFFLAIAWSCQKENVSLMSAKTREQASLAASNNSQLLTTAQDVADITSSALAGQGVAGGRTLTYGRVADGDHGDHDPCGPTVTGTFSFTEKHDTIIYSGKLTIDFGDGTACHDSTEMHKGKIIDSFTLILTRNDSISFNLTDSITFEGFHKDTVTVDGLFVKRSTSWKNWTLDISNAKITYQDGTMVSWSGSLNTVIGPGAIGMNDTDGDNGSDSTHTSDGGHYGHFSFSKTVTGSIHGTTRDGAEFTAEITKPLVYQCGCSKRIPVSGTVKITVAGVESDVDYGDGTCDRKYSVTTAGVTTDFTLRKV